MNMDRSMLSHKKLSHEYWDEVIACIVYLLNKSPIVSVQDKIPEEAWSGTKTSVAHLRFFGSVSFSHVPDEIRRNMDLFPREQIRDLLQVQRVQVPDWEAVLQVH